MKNKFSILTMLSLLLVSVLTYGQAQKVDTLRVFYMGGQSNMDGYGYVSELPDTLNKTFENVWIFHGNPTPDDKPGGGMGVWEKLQPGHGGWMFSSDEKGNKLTNRFGVELSFAAKIKEFYPNEKIALIKYSKGGTSLDTLAPNYGCWDPEYVGVKGINQYDNFLTTVTNAYRIKDIDGNGIDDVLIPEGIIWMQGEADAIKKISAEKYYYNLKRMMGLIRAAFRKDNIPIVIGKISDSGQDEKDGKVWDYLDLVQYAQEQFVENDRHASIIRDTEKYSYTDEAHYDSKSLIEFGEKFASELYKLKSSIE
ncbi:sialate O-acetylesterase [Marinilabilia rubra]|uniref:Sialate O-acetylesterase domain-containing protein n=1 Tax=Marinilabilia rubra TaxID=2162893 RepID=A0A2U2BC13_9BACT|nr:sialate O-acetylesterase [Marinilabilia rubra]PWE00612.1 hypothetical protein DDZ16_03160 [Marinilabilia rubra]